MTKENEHAVMTSLSKRPRRVRLALVNAFILFCGILIGSGATVFVGRAVLKRATEQSDWLPKRITRQLDRELDLTGAQRDQVDAIMLTHFDALQQLRTRVRPEVDTILGGIDDDMRRVLNKEQEERWIKRFTNMKGRWLRGMPEKKDNEE